jgi:hypothetical protein
MVCNPMRVVHGTAYIDHQCRCRPLCCCLRHRRHCRHRPGPRRRRRRPRRLRNCYHDTAGCHAHLMCRAKTELSTSCKPGCTSRRRHSLASLIIVCSPVKVVLTSRGSACHDCCRKPLLQACNLGAAASRALRCVLTTGRCHCHRRLDLCSLSRCGQLGPCSQPLPVIPLDRFAVVWCL